MINALMATRDSPFKGILSVLLVDCLRNLLDTPSRILYKKRVENLAAAVKRFTRCPSVI